MEAMKVTSESRPETHSFFVRMGELGGWAVIVLIPALGMVMIRSDWGEAGHRWTPQPTLEAFVKEFLRFHPEYIMRKFAYEKKEDWERVCNPAKTRRHMLETLAENACVVTEDDKEAYRDRVEEIKSFVAILDDYGRSSHSVSVALHDAPGALWERFGSELYEYICYDRSPRYAFWEDTLIPWIQDYLRTRAL